MRTTLTLEPDVAKALERLRRERDTSLKEVVNDTLRAGLAAQEAPAKGRGLYRTPGSAGRPRLPNVDSVADVVALAEGDSHS